MKLVENLKWYHRLWNVCAFPIIFVLFVTLVMLWVPMYIIFGDYATSKIIEWSTFLWIEEEEKSDYLNNLPRPRSPIEYE